ncbi:MAG: hypothetical protein R3A45_00070 [Bdellovibrionota bacterium]
MVRFLAFDKGFEEDVQGQKDFWTKAALLLKPLVRRATYVFIFLILAVLGQAKLVLVIMSIAPFIALILILKSLKGAVTGAKDHAQDKCHPESKLVAGD